MFGWLRRTPPAQTEQQRQLALALVDYPPYSPPDWNPDTASLHDANLEYREYFFGSRQMRLDSLRIFLAKFDVALNLDDAGLMAVSAWMPVYGDLLLPDSDDDSVEDAYRGFTASWTEALSGLNPIFDLGVYYAECLWARRTRLKWLIVRGPEGPWTTHFISGLFGGRFFDPIHWTYGECRKIRDAKRMMSKRVPYAEGFLRSDHLFRCIHAQAPSAGRRAKTQSR
jgi:hypothetical protein